MRQRGQCGSVTNPDAHSGTLASRFHLVSSRRGHRPSRPDDGSTAGGTRLHDQRHELRERRDGTIGCVAATNVAFVSNTR